jgi:hypothetical protein
LFDVRAVSLPPVALPPPFAELRSANLTAPVHSLSKRGFSGRATYYSVGVGACGGTNSNSDFVVALNEAQYGDLGSVSSYCFDTITISYGGKTHTAQIVDACPGCPYGGLDMSPALFEYFASKSVG